MAFVFGYGSLAPDGALPARLNGYRRAWSVAMDNADTIPGYKYYVDAAGERPDVYVTFLDLVPGGAVDGAVLEVGDLGALDERERNYDRVDVTSVVDADLDDQVWAYLGSADGRRRYEAGRRAGSIVVARDYLETVIEVAAPPVLPVLDLTRVEVP